MFICGDAPGEGCGICIPGMFISILGDAPGDGLGMGMFMSIFGCDDVGELGEAVGICIPGMFMGVCCDGCVVGFVDFAGADDPVFARPGIFIPGMLPMLCLVAVARGFLVDLRRLPLVLRFVFALLFDMFMPGMFCMS